jgi:hypothetical protein
MVRLSNVKANRSADGLHRGGVIATFGSQLRKGVWPRSGSVWLVAFYVALFVIRPWEKLLPWLGEFHFERSYALFMIAVAVISRRKRLEMTFQSSALLLMLGGIGISCAFAYNSSVAWVEFYKISTVVVFYFILLKIIASPYELVFVMVCYVVTVSTYLAKSLWEFFLYGSHRYAQSVVRLVGIESSYGGPNWFAVSIVLSMPIGYFLWCVRKELCLRWPPTLKKLFAPCLGVYFILSTSAVILTNSRSGMVSFLLFILLLVLRGEGLGKKVAYCVLSCFILGVIWYTVPEMSKGRFLTIIRPETGPKGSYDSAMGRIEGLKAGLVFFERFPITGIGVGNFILYRAKNFDGVTEEAHSLVGQVLGETGLIGFGTFCLFVGTILVNCRRIRRLSRNRGDETEGALSKLGSAMRDVVILLFFEGIFNHNMLRYNWVWIAAFSQLGLSFMKKHVEDRNEIEKQ